jgi:hypothetical protein
MLVDNQDRLIVEICILIHPSTKVNQQSRILSVVIMIGRLRCSRYDEMYLYQGIQTDFFPFESIIKYISLHYFPLYRY